MRPLILVLLTAIAMALFPFVDSTAQVPAADPFPQNVWEWENPLPAGQTIADFSVVNESVTYASCLGGLVLKTIDGGESWQVLNTGMPGYPAALKAYPNPFNPSTNVAYRIPRAGQVTLDIHDLRGHRVATLVHAFQAAGGYEVNWRAQDPEGRALPSGTYFVRVVLDGRPVGLAVGLSLIK